jgi:hypothetical protein
MSLTTVAILIVVDKLLRDVVEWSINYAASITSQVGNIRLGLNLNSKHLATLYPSAQIDYYVV